MALTPCRECGAQVSTRARACPRCGARVRRTSLFTKMVLIFFGFALVGTVVGNVTSQMERAREITRQAELTPEERETERRAKEAATQAKAEREANFQKVLAVAQTVKQAANDPKSIEFEEALMTDAGAIAIKFRGRNAFGGLIVNYVVVAPNGRMISGTQSDIAAMWNKHIANKQYTDFTKSIKGAQFLHAL